MTTLLCLLFFLSGASALIFEALWFRLSGLVLGSSVWAASIVLGSFMGGLALGAGLAALLGRRIRSPLFVYALLEIVVGISGLAVVLALPLLTGVLVPVFHSAQSSPVLLNVLRGCVAFSMMAVSAASMGATLPVLVKALYRADPNFGSVLGRLYGWNTLGAVAGVIAADALLIRLLGIKSAGVAAAMLNFSAAAGAVYVYRRFGPLLQGARGMGRTGERQVSGAFELFGPPVWARRAGLARLLAAGFISGFVLLALEVVWFRFMVMFVTGHALNFAVMLAVVLAGISGGGLAASAWFRKSAWADRALVPLALLNGVIIACQYAGFGAVYTFSERAIPGSAAVAGSLFLMFPVSFISGILFTMIGRALHSQMGEETLSTGLLTVFNTLGGMAGSITAAAFFLPVLGTEKSFLAAIVLYSVLGFLLLGRRQLEFFRERMALNALTLAGLVLAVLFYPFGKMERHYLDLSLGGYRSFGMRRVAVREGLTETIQVLEKDLLGMPHYHFLVTNNFSMSSTFYKGKRYMKLYVYLPAALHPGLKNALLIGYGCGSTARAMTGTAGLEQIDIVDISRDIIETGRVLFPDPRQNPVNDPRVRVHIEDGRFHLLTTEKKYDLITAEPPPPKHNGIVNLYTREYFQLIHDRLNDGGFATYWLPVAQLSDAESKSILRAFSEVFGNASLWTAAEYEWMMMGVKNPGPAVSAHKFARQWHDSTVAQELAALGFGVPEIMGSLFIADGDRLKNWVAGARPLTDNFPGRLPPGRPDEAETIPVYSGFMDPGRSRDNFLRSPIIRQTWPDSLIAASAEYFSVRQTINELMANDRRKKTPPVELLHETFENPLLRGGFLLWALQSDRDAQNIMAKTSMRINPGDLKALAPYSAHLAARAAQQGDLASAEKFLHMASDFYGPSYLWNSVYQARVYLLDRMGRKADARKVAEQFNRMARGASSAPR